MARDDGGAAGTVIVAFVLGAITGAAVALLMAPATGDETRRKLAEKAREAPSGPTRRRAGTRVPGSPARDRATAVERGREAYEQARSGARRLSPRRTRARRSVTTERALPRHHRARHAGDGADPGGRHRRGGARGPAGAEDAGVGAGRVRPLIAKVSAARRRSVADRDPGDRPGPEDRSAGDRPDSPRSTRPRGRPAGDS